MELAQTLHAFHHFVLPHSHDAGAGFVEHLDAAGLIHRPNHKRVRLFWVPVNLEFRQPPPRAVVVVANVGLLAWEMVWFGWVVAQVICVVAPYFVVHAQRRHDGAVGAPRALVQGKGVRQDVQRLLHVPAVKDTAASVQARR